jgi:drug/metabolite transporter (DMT)-like permease
LEGIYFPLKSHLNLPIRAPGIVTFLVSVDRETRTGDDRRPGRPAGEWILTDREHRNEALKGHAAMFAFAVAISGSFSLGKLAAPHLDPAALNAIRFVLAGCLIAPLALRRLRREHLHAAWRYPVLGGVFAIYFYLMFEALRLTDPVSTAAVFTLTPLMSAVFGWFLLRQVTTPRIAVSLVIAGVGAIWVIFRADIDRILAFDLGLGEIVFLFGCAAHAFYTPLVRRLNRGEPVVVFTFGTIVAGAVLLGLAGSRSILATDWAALPNIVWITIAYLAVFATAGSFMMVQFATLRLPSSKVMAYGYLVPSFVILWEGLSGHGWVSASVLLGAGATVLGLLILLGPDHVASGPPSAAATRPETDAPGTAPHR